MSESAYGGESAGWEPAHGGGSSYGESARERDEVLDYSEPGVRTIMEMLSRRSKAPNYIGESQYSREIQRKTATKQQEETPKQQTIVIRGQLQEQTPKKQTPENKTRIIRGPENSEQEKSVYDIGELRKRVMGELYDEFFTDIKNEVREELLKEKPVIVREITDELREKLKADLRKNFIQGEDGGR